MGVGTDGAVERQVRQLFPCGVQLEVLIEFGQCHAGSSNLLHTQIILQPLFCVELMATLAKCMEEYEEKYGAIDRVSKK